MMNEETKKRLTDILSITNSSERTQQFSALRDADPYTALDAVIQLMHSSNQTVRRRASSSLSWFRDFAGTKAAELADMLQHHEDERVRLSCAIHLMPVQSPAVDQAFLAALKDPSDRVIQLAYAEVTARAGTQAAGVLAEMLTHRSWRVRLEACKALITLKKADDRVIAALEAMSREPEAAVYDSECDEQPLDVKGLFEFCEGLGILTKAEKAELAAQPQPEPWGKLHTILARARQVVS